MREDEDLARALLTTSRTVAVLGAFPKSGSHRPAHYVPAYLRSQGYRILPVNPRFAGQDVLGSTCVAKLPEVAEAVDFVDVFRRPDFLPDHVPEILAMQPRPKAVWFQSGIVNDEVAAALRAEGIEVVQDRCAYADHRRFGIPAIG